MASTYALHNIENDTIIIEWGTDEFEYEEEFDDLCEAAQVFCSLVSGDRPVSPVEESAVDWSFMMEDVAYDDPGNARTNDTVCGVPVWVSGSPTGIAKDFVDMIRN